MAIVNTMPVGRTDAVWLPYSWSLAGKPLSVPHAVLIKVPREFGARLWNGLYYQMRITDQGIVGEPQAIDLGHIGSPPGEIPVPPYGLAERREIPANSRWISRMSIE